MLSSTCAPVDVFVLKWDVFRCIIGALLSPCSAKGLLISNNTNASNSIQCMNLTNDGTAEGEHACGGGWFPLTWSGQENDGHRITLLRLMNSPLQDHMKWTLVYQNCVIGFRPRAVLFPLTTVDSLCDISGTESGDRILMPAAAAFRAQAKCKCSREHAGNVGRSTLANVISFHIRQTYLKHIMDQPVKEM